MGPGASAPPNSGPEFQATVARDLEAVWSRYLEAADVEGRAKLRPYLDERLRMVDPSMTVGSSTVRS